MSKRKTPKGRTIKERIDTLRDLQKKYNNRVEKEIKALQGQCDHNMVYDPLHKFHKCVCCQFLEFDNVNQEILTKYWKNAE